MQGIVKCGIYTRVSTDNQAEQEFSSCEAQEEKIKSFISSQENWQVYKIYNDPGYTGANTERPALQELLHDIQGNKINTVLVYKIDRLTRSPRDFYQLIEHFEKHCVDFISITERFDTSTPSGRLLRNIMLTFAQFERELTSERTRDKMFERAKKGLWNGGFVPYGYRREDKKIIPNEKESDTVKLIYESYITSGSLTNVYKTLKNKKLSNRSGDIFLKSHIARILRNSVYTGKVEYSGTTNSGIHIPIISEEIFNKAQIIHKEKEQKLRTYKNFLFSGLVKCKECGSMMSPCFTNKKKNGRTRKYNYYRCTITNKKEWNSCSTRMVSAERLENYVLDYLRRISIDMNYLNSLIFTLKNQPSGYRKGIELSEASPEYTAPALQNFLKSFLSEISRTKSCPPKTRGAELNLLIRKYIKEILYSPAEIEINLNYSEIADDKNNYIGLGSLDAGDRRRATANVAGNCGQARLGVGARSLSSEGRSGRAGGLSVCDELIGSTIKFCPNSLPIKAPNEIHHLRTKFRA